MDIETRMELILKDPTEEVITQQELRELLETKEKISAYDGFEPSGFAHLGSGLLRAIKLEDLIKAKIDFKLLIADWYAWINNKLGGDMEKIKLAGKYLVEVWKACGVDTKKVEIIWFSDFVSDPEYWKKVIQIAKITTVKRIIRCSPIMGRKEAELNYAAQLFYPAMQAADPFHLNIDICQLGMDQRHATMLSREVAEKLGFPKPVCVHHHLLLGLQAGKRMGKEDFEVKMSKSKPLSAIFVHDTYEQIKEKIKKAFCPPTAENNPILEIVRFILFRKFDSMEIKTKHGSESFSCYADLEKAYIEGKIHPLDLKEAVAEKLNEILTPIREHFEKNKKAKELYETVKSFEITR
ncbi:MAG TPA: tyrosine--tRNA ligase [Nanoarchaeota archaeon]|nr:tyrosine--tRNA ligase [Nanoarchaeota archaeon]